MTLCSGAEGSLWQREWPYPPHFLTRRMPAGDPMQWSRGLPMAGRTAQGDHLWPITMPAGNPVEGRLRLKKGQVAQGDPLWIKQQKNTEKGEAILVRGVDEQLWWCLLTQLDRTW